MNSTCVCQQRSPGRSVAVVLILLAWVAIASGADHLRGGATLTALDRYVAKPDPAFTWRKAAEVRLEGAVAYTLDMVSQQWLTPAEVNRTEWRHWVQIVKPDQAAQSTALLIISGGSNRPGEPPRPSREFADLALKTRSVVIELRTVPNQPLIFEHDGQERREDDLIGRSWTKYLETGDERWPARLPMTKAAVRAMDAATAFLASEAGGRFKLDTFVVAGASKRGWTTWTTAAVDKRVVAICPLVIDALNVEQSIVHHFRSYGFYAPAVRDYVQHRIVDWIGSPESKALYAIEDPYSYRDRLALPKLLINACGDQFFPSDSAQFYFKDLPGAKYLRYVPNTDHSLRNSDAMQTLQAWHEAVLRRLKLPRFTWTYRSGGVVTVTTSAAPSQALLWQATNPQARDFRLETLGPKWTSTSLEGKDGVFSATIAPPPQGWTAHMIEMTFDIGAAVPLKLTTEVKVTPEMLPFAAPTPVPPKGFLSKQ